MVEAARHQPGVVRLAARGAFEVELEPERILPLPDGADAEVRPGARIAPGFIESSVRTGEFCVLTVRELMENVGVEVEFSRRIRRKTLTLRSSRWQAN